MNENVIIVTSGSPGVFDLINEELSKKLDCGIVTIPEMGIAKSRKVLKKYGLTFTEDVPLDLAGDELAIEISENLYLYVIYYLNEDNVYDFHCEVIDEEELESILNEEEETEET